MEALSTQASQGNSSTKSEDNNPHNESGRESPPPNCAICLGTCKNKSFTDSCLHQFCFKCLLTWSKVKAECPLCKQGFRSIIHNVQSNHVYEEYILEQTEGVERIDIESMANARRFRYRTTLTLPRRESIAFQQLLLHYSMGDVFPAPAHRRRPPSYFRRTVYRHNLWARPLPDFTGRYRDCSPEFYRYNNSQMHRLVPWLNREFHYLLNENAGHISYVMTQIMDLFPRYHINSPEFRDAVHRYFGDRTEHFLHELYCFASTPYDMAGYDRNVQYTTDSRVSTMVNEVLSSSDSDTSVDSDIVMVSRSEAPEPPPGPSRIPAPVYPQNTISEPSNNVISIETLSQSDSDGDSSEVMVVGYIKPPHARTPEVVDLLGSDSDVVLEEEVQPVAPTTLPLPAEPETRPQPLVKLTLTQPANNVSPVIESQTNESDSSTYTPPPPSRKRKFWSSYTSSEPISESSCSSFVDTATTNSTSSTSSMATTTYYSDSSDSYQERERKTRRKRSKKKNSNSEKSKVKSKKSLKRKHTQNPSAKDEPVNKRSKKSNSGKGVKKSKKSNSISSSSTTNTESAHTEQIPTNEPSTSGVTTRNRTGKSNRENKRLKSVVNVVNKSSRNSSCSETSSQPSSSSKSLGPVHDDQRSTEKNTTETSKSNNYSDSSDSEYNIPLNLTIPRILKFSK